MKQNKKKQEQCPQEATMLGVKEVAERLNITIFAVLSMIEYRDLPAILIDSPDMLWGQFALRIPVAGIEAFEAKSLVDSSAACFVGEHFDRLLDFYGA